LLLYYLVQESKLVAVQNGLKKMAAEAATKEKNLRTREQAVIDSENDLHVGEKIALQPLLCIVLMHLHYFTKLFLD
jgi:hypothetical protein